ncbi:Bromodomain-containing protein [Pluteus cervinus]|uniref:Bromodomain-containing protein n=1 Tax=Pluteus cervinus TaxID=181527 RepID=A0ACD3B7J6_9AGAR|nr:Bromodomain-containing protein [Pluteus cervinus]
MTTKRTPSSFGSSGQGDYSMKNGTKSNVNGHEPRIKVEDENQLSRLAAAVSVDGAKSPTVPTEKVEKASWVELRRGLIQVTPVENDGQPRSMVILTGLKTLFQRQLPNMPREYITRIVYEANSKCLAIIKRGFKVVGGICYRPFPHRGFAEIVFFATTSVDQYKGYGAMLMDHFKNHIRKTYPDMMHFLTYADDFAVGYFEKQGFSKDITLDRSMWAGYIKDYEGATIMQCKLLRKVDYLHKTEILAKQQEAVLAKIKDISRSHIIYPGLPQFQPGPNQASTVDPNDVPGLRESSWNPNMTAKSKSSDYHFMERVLKDLTGRSQAWPFLKPVNLSEVPDYHDFVKNPMDFETMSHRVETNQYPTLDAFVSDAMLIFNNCRKYNDPGSIYVKNAAKLQTVLENMIAQRMKRER